MKSLFARILIWFGATLAVAMIGSGVITAIYMNATDRQPFYSRMVEFELVEARYAYETGGREGLAAFMQRFHSVFEGESILADESGRDLLTGKDRSDLIEQAQRLRYRLAAGTRVPGIRTAEDGHYRFFYIPHRAPAASWFLMPQQLWMFGAAILFCYLLAYNLTKPLRSLEKAVARFGQGDFSARAKSTRADELGQLARAFDHMAERIQTLLDAERRLLLDISHELRSPLARLGVAVELARSGEDREAALNRIQKESDRLNSLVGQLLEVTRAEGDPSTLRRLPVRIDELIAGLVGDISIEAAARGCALEFKPSGPITVEGDPELLRRAVENVIRNAVRYAPRGTRVEVAAESNGAAVISVRDYGPGVPEEALPHIFDPFYRVESDRNRISGGVGLGLSIARRAVALHLGSIAARNMHPGLMVTIELPATRRNGVESAALPQVTNA